MIDSYTEIIPAVSRLQKLHPEWGLRRLAAHIECDRDTVRKAVAVIASKENYRNEKIGFFDIEASNLNADFGIVLSYCILPDYTDKIIANVIKPSELRDDAPDKRLIQDFCADVRKFDRIIGYYSSRFDVPFLRTRALLYDLSFPVHNEVLHSDAYFVVRNRLNLHSKRLGVVAPFFGIAAKGHPLTPTVWMKCLTGNEKALRFVLTHNREDVISLKELWLKICPYAQKRNTSI